MALVVFLAKKEASNMAHGFGREISIKHNSSSSNIVTVGHRAHRAARGPSILLRFTAFYYKKQEKNHV